MRNVCNGLNATYATELTRERYRRLSRSALSGY